jgi:hypothetical protein
MRLGRRVSPRAPAEKQQKHKASGGASRGTPSNMLEVLSGEVIRRMSSPSGNKWFSRGAKGGHEPAEHAPLHFFIFSFFSLAIPTKCN